VVVGQPVAGVRPTGTPWPSGDGGRAKVQQASGGSGGVARRVSGGDGVKCGPNTSEVLAARRTRAKGK
jgi:hypothetical protein